jgi:hypothetical protein
MLTVASEKVVFPRVVLALIVGSMLMTTGCFWHHRHHAEYGTTTTVARARAQKSGDGIRSAPPGLGSTNDSRLEFARVAKTSRMEK